MKPGTVRLGVGTRLSYDGELVEVVELLGSPAGNEVVLLNMSGKRTWRVAVKELLASEKALVLPVGETLPDDEADEPVGVTLAALTERQRLQVLERARRTSVRS